MTDHCSFAEAIRLTGFTKSRLLSIAEKAGVDCPDSVDRSLLDTVMQEQKAYISFREFAAQPRGDRYDGSTSSKNKLLDELELHDYFGVTIVESEDLLIGTAKDIVFFLRSDLPKLEDHLSRYFGLFALKEEEKVEHLLNDQGHLDTKKCIRKYLEWKMIEKEITPSFTEFVSIALSLPDLPKIEDRDIMRVLARPMSTTAKIFLIDFLNYARCHTNKVKYSQLKQKKRESEPIPAYSDETYLAMAKCIFNSKYIDQHKMIERALDNHLYIEMWLYLALHFCCGWRAADICRGWRYLCLREKPENLYGINTETLYDDILNDRISDDVYEDACKYATKSIELSGQRHSKTAGPNTPQLAISIAPELSAFFGLLTLISEAVMLRTGDGYMQPNRESLYQKRSVYRHFFGEELYEVLHGRNIQSRRLNKDYLQGIEENARQTGCGSLMASALASFARSHSNLDTIAHYLNDHKLNAENADMVLYFMLERGVFGFELYQTLLTAYPESMKKLPMQKQNEIMAAIADNPYQIELAQSGQAAMIHLRNRFENGDNEQVLNILKGMYEISQGRGKAKDEGIHCLCRAKGMPCAYPEFGSCLANTCPYLVFTRYGYKALLKTIREYKKAADEGNNKMDSVLQNVIMPRFRDILNSLMREVQMNREERQGLQKMLKGALVNGS